MAAQENSPINLESARQLSPAFYPPRRLYTEDGLTHLDLLTPDDVNDKFYFEQNNIDHLGRYTMGSNCETAEQLYDYLSSRHERVRGGLLAPYKMVYVGLYVGEVSLTRTSRNDPTAWIAYHLGEAWQRRGIARHSVDRVIRFAFEDWNASEVLAGIRPSNLRSQRLAQSSGMGRVGNVPGRHLRAVPNGASSPDGEDEPVTWRIAS